MDTLQVLGSAMGLGFLAGIRLYATVFALGLAIRMGWFHLSSSFQHLDVLAQTPVLAVSGLAFAIEFFADKVPWLDSVWDSIHTFIRPIGAALLGAAALGSFDPTTQWLLALLCGGVAFTGHTSKAATRLVANHSPEPFSNIALSLAEDMLVPAGLWVAFEHPLIAIGVVSAFVLLFAWLSPKIFRLLHVSWTALRALIAKAFGQGSPFVNVTLPDTAVRASLEGLPFQPLPTVYSRKLQGKATAGIHAVATASIRGLKNSTGYLSPTPEGLVFVARRTFRYRTHSIPWHEVEKATWKRGLLLDRLILSASGREIAFDVFKAKRRTQHEGFTPAWQRN